MVGERQMVIKGVLKKQTPRKWCLPLTYKPKIAGVRDGTVRQTIRMGSKYHAGDLIMLHGWEGRPYWSRWNWRTKYYTLKEVLNCKLFFDGMSLTVDSIVKWEDLDDIAFRDSIDPPTGIALRDALIGRNGDINGKTAQILRW